MGPNHDVKADTTEKTSLSEASESERNHEAGAPNPDTAGVPPGPKMRIKSRIRAGKEYS
jgi:hypothetical protein